MFFKATPTHDEVGSVRASCAAAGEVRLSFLEESKIPRSAYFGDSSGKQMQPEGVLPDTSEGPAGTPPSAASRESWTLTWHPELDRRARKRRPSPFGSLRTVSEEEALACSVSTEDLVKSITYTVRASPSCTSVALLADVEEGITPLVLPVSELNRRRCNGPGVDIDSSSHGHPEARLPTGHPRSPRCVASPTSGPLGELVAIAGPAPRVGHVIPKHSADDWEGDDGLFF